MLKLKTQNSKLIVVFLLALLFWTCGLQQAAVNSYAQDAKEEESLFVAKKAFEDGFYDVSLGLLERFLKNYSSSALVAEANFYIGRCYFQQGKFLDALRLFEELLNQPQAKNFKDALLYWTGEVHFKGNNFSKAAEYYKMIIDQLAGSTYLASAYYSVGWCLFQEQKFAQALDYFKIVEEKYSQEPQGKDAPFKIVECLYNMKEYDQLREKVKVYLKAFANDPVRKSYLYFYFAEAQYYLNNFEEATDGYGKVLGLTSDDKITALSKLGLGWSYLKLKRYKEAENAFSEVKPENIDARSSEIFTLGRAMLLMETSRVNEAKQMYEQLVNTASDPLVALQAYLGKADALYNLADYSQAILTYQEALKKADSVATPKELVDKIHYSLAWANLKQGEFKDAIAEFQRIAKSSQDRIVQVSALCQIGDAYQDSGDYKKAQDSYDTILKNYPDSFYSDYVQYQLGLVFLKSSNYDGAVMSFLALKKNYPQSKLLDDAAYALGLTYFQRQDYNSSKEVFVKFQEEFKESSLKPQALYLFGTSLYNLASYAQAIEVFKEITRNYSQDTEFVQKAEYEIADCYFQMGNEPEAMVRFNALRAKYPDSTLSAEIMWWLGGYHYRHNDFNLARRYFTSLIKDFPKSSLVADAYYALGSTYTEESLHDEAIDNFKKVIDLGRPDLAGQAAVAIADIYVKQTNPELALKTYKDIIQQYPNLTNLIYPKVADLFSATGDFNQALEFYRKSLDLVPVKEMAGIQLKIAETFQSQAKNRQAVEEYLKVTYLYSENSSLAVKALLRVAQVYEGEENFKEALNIYTRIISMNTEEAKYAQERVDWIKANVK